MENPEAATRTPRLERAECRTGNHDEPGEQRYQRHRAGILASLLLSRTIATQLYGVTPHDALTFVGVPIVLALVALAACIGPARRAAKLDPIEALRADG